MVRYVHMNIYDDSTEKEILKELRKYVDLRYWRGFVFIHIDMDDGGFYRPNYYKMMYYLKSMGILFDYLAMGNEDFDIDHVENSDCVVSVDVDGTLLKYYYDPDRGTRFHMFNTDLIELLNKLYDQNCLIIVWTARPHTKWWSTYRDLKDSGLKFDGLVTDKQPQNLLIDDIPVIHPDNINTNIIEDITGKKLE